MNEWVLGVSKTFLTKTLKHTQTFCAHLAALQSTLSTLHQKTNGSVLEGPRYACLAPVCICCVFVYVSEGVCVCVRQRERERERERVCVCLCAPVYVQVMHVALV